MRPAHWATPLDDRPGLSNLYRVSPDLLRGAQPEAEGIVHLKRLGVRTVVNLRAYHTVDDGYSAAGLDYVSIPVKAWQIDDRPVVAFLRRVADSDQGTVFVHCQYGADRTGVMSAAYRIVIQGWSKEEAILEMTEGGFGFHATWQHLIEYIQGIEVTHLRTLVGLDGQ